MKYENICTKRSYEKNGTTKTVWLTVGRMKTTDEGKRFIELNMFPNTPFYVFEQKQKDEQESQEWVNSEQ
jgi:hypothetical protein